MDWERLISAKRLGMEGLESAHKDDTYLTAVIGINGAGSIQNCYSLLDGQTAAGADLSLKSGGK